MSDNTENPPGGEGDDAAFDELVNNQTSEDEGPVELSTLWDGVEYVWKKFHAGDILVRGIFLAEYVDEDGDNSFAWVTSPDMPAWTATGLLQQALSDIKDENVAMIFASIFKEMTKDEEEDDDEDIQ